MPVMYDLSGSGGQMGHVLTDWKSLVDQMHIGRDEPDEPPA